MKLLLTGTLLLLTTFVFAQDLVYKPKNPAFGGDTFNYQWLQSSATAQDRTGEDREQFGFNQGSTLDDFTESLNRQILNELSRQLITNQFGEGGLQDGSYAFGSYNIDVATTLDGIVVTILDGSLGEQTQLIIPFY